MRSEEYSCEVFLNKYEKENWPFYEQILNRNNNKIIRKTTDGYNLTKEKIEKFNFVYGDAVVKISNGKQVSIDLKVGGELYGFFIAKSTGLGYSKNYGNKTKYGYIDFLCIKGINIYKYHHIYRYKSKRIHEWCNAHKERIIFHPKSNSPGFFINLFDDLGEPDEILY